MKKALIYSPYLDTLGGGERYTLSFAEALKHFGYEITLAWPDPRILSQAKERFNLDTNFGCDAIAFGVFCRGSLGSKYALTRQFDLVFFVSDGSLPFLFGKKNLVHFQVPFRKIGGNVVTNILKTAKISQYVYNSRFTADVVRPQLPLSRDVVIYPPIDVEGFTPGNKEDVILSVSRFDSPSHAKRHDVLIDAFRQFRKKGGKANLVLAGGVRGEGGEAHIKTLRAKAIDLPITFIINSEFGKLKQLYAKAKIFWHTAGYGIDEKKEPEKVEHFGMTTVEAMAAGAVPVVIDKGGQREIITKESGILCAGINQMVDQTLFLVGSEKQLRTMSEEAVKRAKFFSVSNFEEQVKSLL